MLKLIKKNIKDGIGRFDIEIEGNKEMIYNASFDLKSEDIKCIETNIPSELKSYIRMARTALWERKIEDIPDVIPCMWY